MFLASIEGTATIHSRTEAFIAAFVRRVEKELLPGTPPWRCQYEVVRKGSEEFRFRAVNWWTAINVGLNDVDVAATSGGRVHYKVAYLRWASYVLALSGMLGLAFVAGLLMFDVRTYVEQRAASRLPGLSTDQNVAIAWVMALFWGFAWPWILVALHKRPLNRLMNRIIAEVDAVSEKQQGKPKNTDRT
jgi:hypothetical protein